MNLRKFSLLSGLGVAAAIVLSGCGGSKSQTLATVNGDKITMDQFYAYLEAKPEVQVVLENGQVATARVSETLAFQALQELIRQRIILQLAKDDKLAPTPKDIENEVQFQRGREPNFILNLRERGLTTDQMKESLAVDLAKERLLSKGIEFSDADVDAFIKANPQRFVRPAAVEAKWIFVKTDSDKRVVDRELQSGSSFSSVARRYSKDPNAKQNLGYFPRTDVDNLPPDIQKPLKETAIGRESDWIKLSDGWAKFSVDKRTAPEKIVMNKFEKEWLKRQLIMQKGLQNNDLDRKLLDKLKTSDINVAYAELQTPWKNAFNRLKEVDSEESTEKATGATE